SSRTWSRVTPTPSVSTGPRASTIAPERTEPSCGIRIELMDMSVSPGMDRDRDGRAFEAGLRGRAGGSGMHVPSEHVRLRLFELFVGIERLELAAREPASEQHAQGDEQRDQDREEDAEGARLQKPERDERDDLDQREEMDPRGRHAADVMRR